ncbi:Cof-type HAD-IIB family hydrolase [Salisediminibacterium beveridgei]|nr:Cof-type HAD-IIB family hydrolase [Salisediminibacterium beveridgei]
MKNKAVFFDIDGTLLNHDKLLPASTKEAIATLKAAGHFVGIATGRAPFMFEELRQELEIDTFVSFNGQYVVHKEEPVLRNALAPEAVKELVDFAKEKDHPLVFMDHTGMRANDTEHAYIYEAIGSLKFDYPPFDPDYYQNRALYQTLLFCKDGEEAPYQARFDAFDFIRWHEKSTDILPAKGSKAKGIEALITKLNLNPDDVYVFGDGPNDVEMIASSKHGIAMGNSVPQTKAVADFVTKDVNDDGVVHGLKHVGLL